MSGQKVGSCRSKRTPIHDIPQLPLQDPHQISKLSRLLLTRLPAELVDLILRHGSPLKYGQIRCDLNTRAVTGAPPRLEGLPLSQLQQATSAFTMSVIPNKLRPSESSGRRFTQDGKWEKCDEDWLKQGRIGSMAVLVDMEAWNTEALAGEDENWDIPKLRLVLTINWKNTFVLRRGWGERKTGTWWLTVHGSRFLETLLGTRHEYVKHVGLMVEGVPPDGRVTINRAEFAVYSNWKFEVKVCLRRLGRWELKRKIMFDILPVCGQTVFEKFLLLQYHNVFGTGSFYSIYWQVPLPN